MLKILRSWQHTSTVVALSGRIEDSDLSDLQIVIEREFPTQDLTLDLEEVTLVHRGGLRFLADCEAKGINLKNCPAYIREWLGAGRKPASLSDPSHMRTKS